ncbi:MAG: DUF6531 domain-containing protein [Actinomycetaceae bacterium]|nr:DUF6531 domain-containing protein [Actinomycetaceae bacterium]
MGELKAMDDVVFDFRVAQDLADRCRAVAGRLEQIQWVREYSWVGTALKDFQGYFATLFKENAEAATVDSRNLNICLRDIADKVELLAEAAKKENEVRKRAREWAQRRAAKWDIHRGFDDVFSLDPPPVETTGDAPVQTSEPPSLLKRDTPSKGSGGNGTSSARPDNLRAFASNASEGDTELEGYVGELEGIYEDFSNGCQWGKLHASGVFRGFRGFILANREDNYWALTIAKAFEEAGTGGEISTLSDWALEEALKAQGISASRMEITLTPPEMRGEIPTSGFADDPVNVATGNFIEVERDLSFFGAGAPLEWTRTYNALSDVVGAFGIGWSSVADSRLDFDNAGHAQWVMTDGRVIVFPRQGEAWDRSRGDSYWLEKSDQGYFAITNHSGALWEFNASGDLLATSCGEGTRVEYVYSGQHLSAVVHERGWRVDIEWDLDAHRIHRVYCPDGREVTYSYDEAGRLISSQGGELTSRTYHWNEQGLIDQVYDADGVRLVHNMYDDQGRIHSQKSPEGRTSVYTYLPGGVTEVADDDRTRPNVWVSDTYGRLTAVVDTDGQRQTMSYDRWGNQILFKSRAGGLTAREFDDRGRPTAAIDPARLRTNWQWDDSDRLISLTLTIPEGGQDARSAAKNARVATTLLEYEGDNRDPSVITDPLGARTELQWRNGQLVQIRDGAGVVTRFEYDSHGNLVGIIDAAGNKTQGHYDAAGRVIATISPSGRTTRYEWNDAGLMTRRIDPSGATWTIEYSPAGRVRSFADPCGARTTIEYDQSGQEVATIDPLGRRLEKGWDDFGNLTTVRLPDGREWSYVHDALSRLRTITTPAGATWEATYDAVGRPTKLRDPLGDLAVLTWSEGNGLRIDTSDEPAGQIVDVDALGRPTRWASALGDNAVIVRDLAGRISEVIDRDGSSTRIERDGAGKPTHISSRAGNVSIEYDQCGRRSAVTTSQGRTEFTYDADSLLIRQEASNGSHIDLEWDRDGRIVRAATPGLTPSSWKYDAAGRVTMLRDATWGKRTFTWDAAGQLTSVTNALGGTTHYSYDDCGRVVDICDPLGNHTTRTYTANDRVESETDPLGRTTRAGYNLAGQQIWQEEPDGQRLAWSRSDGWEELASIAPSGTKSVFARWSEDGRSQQIMNPDGSITAIEVDSWGLPKVHSRDGKEISRWVRDDFGRVLKHSSLASTVTYSWDEGGALEAIHSTAFGEVSYEHSPTSVSMEARDLSQRWERDEYGRVISYSLSSPEGDVTESLGYDDHGRLMCRTRNGVDTTYSYDEAGQLTQIISPDTSVEYEWDLAGHLLRCVTITKDGTAEETFTYDAAGQVIRRSAGNKEWTYAYDLAGRRISENGPDGRFSYSWDPTGLLGGINSGTDALLSRDSLGLPVEIDGVAIEWDLDTLTPLRIGDTPVTSIPGGTALGSTFLPVGSRPYWTSSPENPWEQVGSPIPGVSEHLRLTATGTIQFQGVDLLGVRALHGPTYSFLSQDPLEQFPQSPWASNPYSYAANMPTMATDFSGLKPLTDKDLTKYNQDNRGFGAKVLDWGKENWEYIAGGLGVAGGVALMFAPFPGAQVVGLGLMSAGADTILQKATTGKVDWQSVSVSGAVGLLGGLGGWAAKALTTAGKTAPLWAVAGVHGGTGAISGAAGYILPQVFRNKPIEPLGLVGAMLGGGISAGFGGISAPASTTIAKRIFNSIGDEDFNLLLNCQINLFGGSLGSLTQQLVSNPGELPNPIIALASGAWGMGTGVGADKVFKHIDFNPGTYVNLKELTRTAPSTVRDTFNINRPNTRALWSGAGTSAITSTIGEWTNPLSYFDY